MTDLTIAKQAAIRPIQEIAQRAGIAEDALELYGKYKAKIDVDKLPKTNADGKVVLVTAISPTPAGEGKSTVTVGLADALKQSGESVMVALREPSLGPVMGVKGGATGGGGRRGRGQPRDHRGRHPGKHRRRAGQFPVAGGSGRIRRTAAGQRSLHRPL